MRFPFLELPGERFALARPVVPLQLEDLEEAPLLCLVDTGATGNRFGAELAGVAGISLDDPLDATDIVVGGLTTSARCVRAALTLGSVRFEAPIWFCDPWPFGFGLLGQEGFLRFFRLTISAAEGWLECEPEPRSSGYRVIASGEGPGDSLADVPEEEPLSGFGE